jgi:hypothetical protein
MLQNASIIFQTLSGRSRDERNVASTGSSPLIPLQVAQRPFFESGGESEVSELEIRPRPIGVIGNNALKRIKDYKVELAQKFPSIGKRDYFFRFPVSRARQNFFSDFVFFHCPSGEQSKAISPLWNDNFPHFRVTNEN